MNSPAIIQGVNIDEFLGPSDSRYFGSGYRRIRHDIRDIDMDCETGKFDATIGIEYPQDWSKKGARGDLRPHLSTVDILVTAIQLCDAFLLCRFGFNVEQERQLWLHHIGIKSARTAHEDLNNIPVQGRYVSCTPSASNGASHLSTFDVRIAGFSVDVTVAHPLSESRFPFGPRVVLKHLDELLGRSRRSLYGHHYKSLTHNIYDINFPRDEALCARVEILEDSGYAPTVGVGSGFSGYASAVDMMITGAQLAQTLMYRLDNLSRKNSHNLWMRAFSISMPHPVPRLAPLDLDVGVTKTRICSMAGAPWRTAEMTSSCSQIENFTMSAVIAHQLPSGE
ncbi:MAG: AvrD family protein [Alcanivoracaceae bacterium]|nr:AvrD family protein [Alcanivoracaceae bacterium]